MSKYKVGDKVKIRSLESMIKEFGMKRTGNIDCGKDCLVMDIRNYCGKSFVIHEINPNETYRLKNIDWSWTEEMFEEEKEQSIHITKIGSGVYAVLKENGNVIKRSKATWDKEEDFNFEYGSKLAIDRLFDEKEVDEFKPCLAYSHNDKVISDIGIKTNMTLAFGEELYIGDVVEVYDVAENKIVEKEFVCGNDFVMGLKNIEFKNGIDSSGKCQIRKVQSYKDLKHNQIVDDVTVKLKEE